MAPKANVSGMCAVMQRIDRLLPGADVFDSDRQLLKGRQSTPGPGDFVLFNNHVALLRGIDTEGRIHTIEGNTYAFTDTRRPQRKVWGIFCKSYSAEKNPERWTDLKFGLSASR